MLDGQRSPPMRIGKELWPSLPTEGDEGAPLETTGERIVDPRLDVFREFVNSLDVDLGPGEGRPPSE